MPRIALRTLHQNVFIEVPVGPAYETLRFIDARPNVEGMEAKQVELACESKHGFLTLTMPEGVSFEGTADHLLGELHLYHYNRTRSEFPNCPMIHGGTVTVDGRHVVIVGDKGAGKTTLLLHLALSGLDVAGDEHIVINGLIGTPRPRTLRVKESALGILPTDIAMQIENAPATRDWHGTRIFAIAPDMFGGRWNIQPAPISDIVFLEPNHGGRSSLRRLGADRALDRLFAGNIVLPDIDKLQALVKLRSLVAGTNLWLLENGNIDQCTDLVYQILDQFNSMGE